MGFGQTAEESARGNEAPPLTRVGPAALGRPCARSLAPGGGEGIETAPSLGEGEGRRLDVEDYAGFFLAFRPPLWVFLTPCVALKCRASGRGCANRRSHFGHCSLLARRAPFVVTPVGCTPGNGTRR